MRKINKEENQVIALNPLSTIQNDAIQFNPPKEKENEKAESLDSFDREFVEGSIIDELPSSSLD